MLGPEESYGSSRLCCRSSKAPKSCVGHRSPESCRRGRLAPKQTPSLLLGGCYCSERFGCPEHSPGLTGGGTKPKCWGCCGGCSKACGFSTKQASRLARLGTEAPEGWSSSCSGRPKPRGAKQRFLCRRAKHATAGAGGGTKEATTLSRLGLCCSEHTTTTHLQPTPSRQSAAGPRALPPHLVVLAPELFQGLSLVLFHAGDALMPGGDLALHTLFHHGIAASQRVELDLTCTRLCLLLWLAETRSVSGSEGSVRSWLAKSSSPEASSLLGLAAKEPTALSRSWGGGETGAEHSS